ncbi:MAG: helix-turn-helix domain-containing protein [Syntrophobacterales bacterium]|jgi:transcriptional regulator with XRE-family HTH domain|nr:helix-turn-helix domain-containing protein [Syntrophobacterales bacterium]
MIGISDRVRELLREKGLRIQDLANLTQIDQSQLSRMLRNKRHWSVLHLQAVSKALGVSIGDLTDEIVMVPVVAKIDASAEIPYPETFRDILGEVALPRFLQGGREIGLPSNIYVLEIGEGYEPALLKGSKVFFAKDTQKHEGDIVAYCNDQKKIRLGQIFFHGDEILLRSLDRHVKDLLLPKKHLAAMDRAFGQTWPAPQD